MKLSATQSFRQSPQICAPRASENFSSGSVDRITLSEAGQIAGATVAGAALTAVGGFAASGFGGWGIPLAVAGEAVIGIAAASAITKGAHDGSVSGGLMAVGAIGGVVAGGLGSLIGLASSSMFGVHPAVGAAAAGAVVAGGFATYLAHGN